MPLSLIIAADDRGVIGANGRLPWHDISDLAWFKHHTASHTLICGRRTAAMLPRLPTRRVITVSRNGLSLDQAIQENPNAFIIGGGEIYEQALPHVRRFFISRIPGEHPGDVLCPFPLPWL